MKIPMRFILLVVVVGAAAIWLWARPIYRQHKEAQAVQRAEEYFAKGDFQNASLSARRGLGLNRRSIGACRVMGALAEAGGGPGLLEWRGRIAELQPDMSNKLALAEAGLRVQGRPWPMAGQVLEELAGCGATNALFQVLSAELALKKGDAQEAEAHFEKASEIEPNNPLHQLNLAALRLESVDSAKAARARAVLEGLSGESRVGLLSLRWLIADALRRKDLPRAEQVSRRLLEEKGVTIADSLKHVEILEALQSTEWEGYLQTVEERAATNAPDVYRVASWLMSRQMAGRAWAWLSGLPEEEQGEGAVRLAKAECYLARRDFGGAQDFLEGQRWGELEFLRLGLGAVAAGGEKNLVSARAQWGLALREAGARLEGLVSLQELAGRWASESVAASEAKEAVLWQIAERFAGQGWAWGELERGYAARGNTRGLHKLYGAMVRGDPKDAVARNNLAATSMLLGVESVGAYRLAGEVYGEHGGEAVFATTYAWGLHLQGRTREALAVVEGLPPERLEAPGVALYYGLLLNADGQTNKAAAYLERGRQGRLLPEEEELVKEARRNRR